MHGTYIGGNLVLVQTAYGGILVGIADDLSLTPFLLCAGAIEAPLTKFLIATVQRGQTVVDVGANIGYFTILLGLLVGDQGHVFAYEANPHLLSILQENTGINSTGAQTELIPHAVAAAVGTAKLYRSMRYHGNSSLFPPSKTYFHNFGGDETEVLTVPTEPLDHLLARTDQIDLIKIDIEGGEHQAFWGMTELLRRGAVGTIVFELNRLRNPDEWQAFHDLLAQISADTGKSFYELDLEGNPVPVSLDRLFAQDFYPFAILK